MDALLKTLEYDVVDIDFIDGREYKLLNVEIPDESSGTSESYKGLYLEMINPSTGESHFEGVANTKSTFSNGWRSGGDLESATVKAALSWRDGDGMVQTGQAWNAPSTTDNYVPPVKMT